MQHGGNNKYRTMVTNDPIHYKRLLESIEMGDDDEDDGQLLELSKLMPNQPIPAWLHSLSFRANNMVLVGAMSNRPRGRWYGPGAWMNWNYVDPSDDCWGNFIFPIERHEGESYPTADEKRELMEVGCHVFGIDRYDGMGRTDHRFITFSQGGTLTAIRLGIPSLLLTKRLAPWARMVNHVRTTGQIGKFKELLSGWPTER